MRKKIKPLNNYILVDPIEPKTTTSSGIYIPPNQKVVEKGIVVDTGSCDFVKKGDVVFFRDYSLEETEEFAFVKEEELLAKI